MNHPNQLESHRVKHHFTNSIKVWSVSSTPFALSSFNSLSGLASWQTFRFFTATNSFLYLLWSHHNWHEISQNSCHTLSSTLRIAVYCLTQRWGINDCFFIWKHIILYKIELSLSLFWNGSLRPRCNKGFEIDNCPTVTSCDMKIPLAEKAFRGYVKLMGEKAFYGTDQSFTTPNEAVPMAFKKLWPNDKRNRIHCLFLSGNKRLLVFSHSL